MAKGPKCINCRLNHSSWLYVFESTCLCKHSRFLMGIKWVSTLWGQPNTAWLKRHHNKTSRLSDLWKWNGWTTECVIQRLISACVYLFALNALLWQRYTNSGQPCVRIMSKMRNTFKERIYKKNIYITKLWVNLGEKQALTQLANDYKLNTLPVTPESIKFLTLASSTTSLKKHKNLVWQNLPESDVAWWSTNNITTKMSNI